MTRKEEIELFIMAKRIVELYEKQPIRKGEELDGVRLSLINAIFQSSKNGRYYIDMCMIDYTRALYKGKKKICIGGLLKLSEIMLEEDTPTS